MITELRMIGFMALSGVLFALGGTMNTEIRRVWLPVATFAFLLLTGKVAWWRLIPACLLSNTPAFQHQVPWKIVEFWTGFFISCTFLGAG